MSASASTHQLQELYRKAGHAEDLFPIFDRTKSFEPWIFVLALIPALYVFQHATLSESDAEWVLRSRDLLQSRSVEGVIGPGGVDSANELRYQPPMGTWLTAAVEAGLREFNGYEGMLLAWIGTAMMIFAIYRVTKTLFGGRIALWAALLSSGQGLILWQAQTVLPISLALLAALGGISFLQDHLRRERGVVTWQVLGGGLCLGLCLLLGGPIVVLPVFIQFLSCLSEILADRGKTVPIVSPIKRVLSLLLMWGICLIASGWWPALMASAYHQEFWLFWWRGISNQTPVLSLTTTVIQYLKVTGPMMGLALYAIRELQKQVAEEKNRSARQLIVWLIGGIVTSMASSWILGPDSLLAIASFTFVSIAFVVCSAVSFDLISRGNVGVLTAIILTLLPLVIVIICDAYQEIPVSGEIWTIRVLSLFCLLSLACLRAIRQQNSFGGRQLLPAICLILIVLINYRIGLSAQAEVHSLTDSRPGLESDQLSQLHKIMSRIPEDVQRIEIISSINQTARFRLEMVLAFPGAQVSFSRNWDRVLEWTEKPNNHETIAVIEWGSPQPRPHLPLSENWRHRYLGQPEKIGDDNELRLSVLFPDQE